MIGKSGVETSGRVVLIFGTLFYPLSTVLETCGESVNIDTLGEMDR